MGSVWITIEEFVCTYVVNRAFDECKVESKEAAGGRRRRKNERETAGRERDSTEEGVRSENENEGEADTRVE